MSIETAPHSALRAAILRALFVITAVAALGGGSVHLALAPGGGRSALALFDAVLAALALWGTFRPLPQAQRLLVPVMLGGIAVTGVAAVTTGAGLQSPGLALLPLALCLVGAIGSRGQHLVISVGAVVATAVVAGSEAGSQLTSGSGVRLAPLGARAALNLLSIALGAAAGATLQALMRRHVGSLVASETRYRHLFGSMPAALVLHRHGRIVDANPAAAALFGFDDVQAMPGRNLYEFYAEGDRRRGSERLQALEKAPPGTVLPMTQFHVRTVDGRALLLRATTALVEAGDGTAMLSFYFDDTERVAATEALQQSQTLLSQVIATSPDSITLTDLDTGRYILVSDSFARMTGHPVAETVGRTATEIGLWSDPADRARLVGMIEREGTVQNQPLEFVRRDGQTVRMRVSGTRFEHGGRRYLLLVSRDTTASDRTRLEYEVLLNSAQIGIAVTRDRRFLIANPHFEQMFGWPPGALIGQPGRAVWPSEEAYADIGQRVGPALSRGEQVDFEGTAMRRDGSTFLARMRATAIDPQRPAEGGTIWTAEDVTQQRHAEAALARARDEAQAANRAKSAFLANMSHEIRTPLNGLVGLARLARQPGVEPARLQQYLEQIGSSAETLSAIISDILDLSKIEAGRLEIESAPFNLLGLLQSIEQAYLALATNNGLAFEVRIDPNLPAWVRGDALRVRQILANFLHNALKFTPRGSVRLVARLLEDDRIRFEVHDTGVGIDEATRARLFKPFTQADESITRRFGGTGLGLSICRELAELMGGEVGVISTPGQGSCFYAELALPHDSGQAEPSGYGPLEGDPLNGARVLLVEDNAVNMMIGVALLEQWGIRVTQAADGPRALAAVEEADRLGRPFNLVLMDLQMPGMSGYEATRALRERHSMQQLPVIALTAAALTSEREHAAEIGMNDFLTKPIDPNRLRQALQRVLAGVDIGRGGAPGAQSSI